MESRDSERPGPTRLISKDPRSNPPRRSLYVLAILTTILALEMLSFGIGRVLAARRVLYFPEHESGYPAYLGLRDPVIGWPSREEFGRGEYDVTGSRLIPAYPTPGNACISLYGDSFTWGDGVAPAEAWSNELSLLLGCRVANYGVCGYGTDQALVRFMENSTDEADVVILAHLSENILRNVNRWRRLIYPQNDFGLKPRFVLDDNEELVRVPIPDLTEEAFESLNVNPSRLEEEYFVPGAESGLRSLTFPYTWAVIRALDHFQIQAKLHGVPRYAAFYRADHPSRGLQITSRILQAFEREARARAKVPLIVVIPTAQDLMHHRKTGEWTYASLLDTTRALGTDVMDAGPAILDALGEEPPSSIFLGGDGHFNAEGNRILAQVISGIIRREVVVPSVARALDAQPSTDRGSRN